MTRNNGPIGIFDSGVGGTTVWREIIKLLPREHTIYLADSKNAPYGQKSKEEIIRLCHKNVRFLLDKGCKLIVVACNTATTNAIVELRASYDISFVGIEPAIKPAALQTQSGVVGILATQGTLSSQLFEATSHKYAGHIKKVEVIGRNLVEQIEKGELSSEETRQLLQSYLQPMLDASMDYLVLGCTHYPYLISTLRQLLPAHVRIIDSGQAVAKQVAAVLETEHLQNDTIDESKHQLYTNIKTNILEQLLSDVTTNYMISYQDF